jgi:hypothetical protein
LQTTRELARSDQSLVLPELLIEVEAIVVVS